MNIKFPDFEFNKWLVHYMFLFDKLETDHGSFVASFEGNYDHFTELQTHFMWQLHISEENETWNYTMLYLDYLTKFTEFMRHITNEPTLYVGDITSFVLKQKYPLQKSIDSIVNLLQKRGCAYRTKGLVLLQPDILENVEYFLKELKINYESK